MDDRSCGAGGRAGEYRRLSEGEIPESVSSVSLSAAVPFVIGNMERPVRQGICFHRLGVLPALLRGVAGYLGERLCLDCVSKRMTLKTGVG